MRIAVVTDDGETISAHFGRAMKYAVLTVEDGKVVARELRDKAGHHTFGQQGPHSHEAGQPHGMGPEAGSRHRQMLASIRDCDVVVARGMGGGAYQGILEAGMKPILTEISGVEEAALAAAAGTLSDHPERLH
jgi:predicted Fe-Mo cluster-binding NifX family protein